MIIPVILCGGAGTRLWPTSRRSFPKQFSYVLDEHSLFQQTALRFAGPTYADPVIVTHNDFRFIVLEQLAQIGVKPSTVLIEPEGRNTGPAILAASLSIAQQDPDQVLLAVPADHFIEDVEELHLAISRGVPFAKAGELVTFGIVPDRPATEYGYLTLSNAVADQPVKLSGFKEKPNRREVEALLSQDHVLWNSGMFLMTADSALRAYRENAMEIFECVHKAVKGLKRDLGFSRLDPASWRDAESISIDHAVMEHADDVYAVALKCKWADLGDWNQVWSNLEQDEDRVARKGKVAAIDCKNTLLWSEGDDVAMIGIGLSDIVAVATSDAVLVSKRGRGEELRQAVELLNADGVLQAACSAKSYRPWGWFECLARGDGFQVKRIFIKPDAALSLQSHRHRSEHWVVVEGTVAAIVGEEQHTITVNQSIYVPAGTVHRVINISDAPAIIIEVQTGAYLSEDDIVRYDDLYARK